MIRWLILFCLFCSPLFAAPKVVVSIKPLNDITSAVMQGVGTPTLLVPVNASPHTYSLAPSQVKALTEADLIVWVGPELETFLTRTLERRKSGANLITVLEIPGMTVYPARGEELLEHGHGSRDPHLWLDPVNLKTYATALAEALSKLDPSHASTFQANALQVNKALAELNQSLESQLQPIHEVPLMVFHDAYQYFQKRYHLDIRGVIVDQPESLPSVFRVLEIQHTLKAENIQCIFAEPQFKPALVDRLVKHTGVKEGVLDPLGSAEPQGLAGTQALFDGLAKGILNCTQP